jgi:PDZ domain-containing secreted protein
MFKVSNNKILKFLFLLFIALSVFAYSNSYAITEPGGQYAIDKADQVKRFEHNSLDNLKMIDFFLCVMKVRADLFPNSNYKAQVNEAACQTLAGDSDDDGAKVKMA